MGGWVGSRGCGVMSGEGVEGGDSGVGRERERSVERLGNPLGAPVGVR